MISLKYLQILSSKYDQYFQYILKFRELKKNKLFYSIYHKVYISGILFIYIVDKRLHGFEKRGFYEIIRNRNITNFILNSLV
jgi:hypothetical protein